MGILTAGLSKILFPAPRPTYTAEDFPGELLWIPKKGSAERRSDGRRERREDDIPGLLLKCDVAKYVVIYLHCNAEDLGMCRSFCGFLRDQFKVHVLAVEYPGYGVCKGTPCCKTVMENAESALHFVTDELRWPLDGVKVFGRSIGTGPAISLASKNEELAGLILIAPFLSIQELLRDRIGSLAHYVSDDFVSKDVMADIACPTFIVHGQADTVVPHAHGKELYKKLKSKKLLVMPPDLEHNSSVLFNLQYFTLPMFHFFDLPEYDCRILEVPDWAWASKPSVAQKKPSDHGFDWTRSRSSTESSETDVLTRMPDGSVLISATQPPRTPRPVGMLLKISTLDEPFVEQDVCVWNEGTTAGLDASMPVGSYMFENALGCTPPQQSGKSCGLRVCSLTPWLHEGQQTEQRPQKLPATGAGNPGRKLCCGGTSTQAKGRVHWRTESVTGCWNIRSGGLKNACSCTPLQDADTYEAEYLDDVQSVLGETFGQRQDSDIWKVTGHEKPKQTPRLAPVRKVSSIQVSI
eukprot:TRINITY_DN27712_c0_g1_i1.p1 TRINITY_DN27712_c0_g1~~TRINITY_DN27712_c0_g1_i1.p1  ORF type:complete len:522 (-),score=86.60 TRINITY_DN27712_c0_g1_i1:208-1773(-)